VGFPEAHAHRTYQTKCLFDAARTWPAKLSITKSSRTATHKLARQLRPTEVDELVAAYSAGATVNQLAVRFEISRDTVGKHLRRRGVDTKPPGIYPADVPEAARLYEGGWSLQRVAEKFGTTASTAQRRLLEVGVVMRPRQGGRHRKP
jgi:DNA-binding transcriptional ArsR family regulator